LTDFGSSFRLWNVIFLHPLCHGSNDSFLRDLEEKCDGQGSELDVVLLASPVFWVGLMVVVPTLPGVVGRRDPDGLLGVLGMTIAKELIGTAVMPVAHGRPVD
jgi:hypothetical protein